MSDTASNKFIAYGTAAQRGAFTPSPATIAAAPFQLYLWYETDTGLLWGYDTTWHNLSNANGAFALASAISPAALGADQNDYNPTGLATANAIRLSASIATVNITGLSGGATGRVLLVFNVGASNNLVLKNESVSSLAANRFDATGDVTLAPSAWTLLWYDGTSSRWRVLVTGGGGGGGGTVTTTGTPANGNLTKFSGATSITNGDLSGDVSTSGTLVTTLATVTVPKGGTGQTTLTNHGVLLGQGASAVVATAAGGSGLPLVGAGGAADPAFGQIAAATALSDYATGNWTPVLSFGGASVGITYADQLGKYVKIGKLVFVTISMQLSNKGSSVGNAVIDGLPFAANTTIHQFQYVNFANNIAGAIWGGFIGIAGGVANTAFVVVNNAMAIQTNAAFVNTTQIVGNFTYMTD